MSYYVTMRQKTVLYRYFLSLPPLITLFHRTIVVEIRKQARLGKSTLQG